MYILRLFLAALLLPGLAVAQRHVSFPTQDGGVVHADLYGKSERGLILAHGGRFTKESWKDQVPAFLNAGFRVLAVDFRGRGQSRGPQSKSGEDGAEYDVLAAVRYLRKIVLIQSRYQIFFFFRIFPTYDLILMTLLPHGLTVTITTPCDSTFAPNFLVNFPKSLC